MKDRHVESPHPQPTQHGSVDSQADWSLAALSGGIGTTPLAVDGGQERSGGAPGSPEDAGHVPLQSGNEEKGLSLSGAGPQARSNHPLLLRYAIIGCALLFVAFVLLLYGKLDPKLFHAWASSLNGWLVFLILATFPLFGFPVSVLFVLAGAKFGSGWGVALTTLAIAIHLTITHWITRSLLHRPIQAIFRRTKYRLPQVDSRDAIPITLLTSLVPGVPYGAKNYLLALAGVRFRPYLLICTPSYALQASVAIFLGDLSGGFTVLRTVLLVSYGLVLAWLARYVVKRLRAKHRAS